MDIDKICTDLQDWLIDEKYGDILHVTYTTDGYSYSFDVLGFNIFDSEIRDSYNEFQGWENATTEEFIEMCKNRIKYQLQKLKPLYSEVIEEEDVIGKLPKGGTGSVKEE